MIFDPQSHPGVWTPIHGYGDRPGHFLPRLVDGLPVWRGPRPWQSVQGPWRQLGRKRYLSEKEIPIASPPQA